MVKDLDIPTLTLDFPINKMQIIILIENTNNFLKNLNKNTHSLDLTVSEDKYPIFDVKRILDKLI